MSPQEKATAKRSRRLARGPGFSAVRPPVPTKRSGKATVDLGGLMATPDMAVAAIPALLAMTSRRKRKTSPLPVGESGRSDDVRAGKAGQ